MMMTKHKEFTIYSSVVQSVAFIGLWLGENRNKVHIIGTFSIFCFLGVYVLQIIALVLARDNPERLFECVSVIFFCGMGILKLFSLYHNREKWLTLLDQMSVVEELSVSYKNNSFAEYESENEEINSDSIKKENSFYSERFRTTLTVLLRIYRFTLVLYITSPYVEYAIWTIYGSRPLKYPHILPAWTPLDCVHFAFYLLMVFVEVVAAAYCNFVHTAFDITSIGIMIFVSGQYTLLFDQCSKIGGRGKACNLFNRRDKRAHSRTIKCHKKHLLLVNCIEELDKLLKNVLGVYFFLSTLTLCSVALQLKSKQMSVMQMVSLVQYTCATLTQLYLFCSFGDAVLNTSSLDVAEGPFGSSIWCLSPKIRKELLLLSIGMMKRRCLRAGPFIRVDLPSFIQIVRAAYSCYAVVGQKS